MNQLTGRLWHACFEQRPFAQEDLVQACLALPKLARFWMGTKNRVTGFAKALVNHGEYRKVRDPVGIIQSHGLGWDFVDHWQSRGEFVYFLRIWVWDHGKQLLYVCQSCPKGPRPDKQDLLTLSSWIEGEAHSCKVYGYAVNNSECFPFEFEKLSDLLDNPVCPNCLSGSKGSLARIIQVYKQTTPENLAIFQALARHSHE